MGEQPLVFERERTGDSITLSMRGEVRHYRYAAPSQTDSLWDGQFSVGAQNVLVVGPRASAVEKPSRLDTFSRLLETSECKLIRILVSDPELYDLIRKLPDADRDRLSRMWGEQYSWENQSDDVKRIFVTLGDYCTSELQDEHKQRVEVKLAHTLIPVGAALRYEASGNDILLVRLHPVGVMNELHPALLRLERRHSKAVFSFYRDYLEKLWESGTTIDWADGKWRQWASASALPAGSKATQG